MSNLPYEILDKNTKTERFFKILVLGDGFVGKTGTTIRFCEGQFKEEYKMTIGVNFGTKRIRYNNISYTIQLWDIAGQERFRSFRVNYYDGALGAIILYDVTNKLTFLDVPNWINEFQEICGSEPIVIAGNKADLPGSGIEDPRVNKPYERQVTFEEGKNLAEPLNATFFETSARLNQNIDNLFTSIIELIDGGYKSKKLQLSSFTTIETGFEMLFKLFEENNIGKLYDVLLRLKQTIFKENPYSVILGNMNQWIQYLPNAQMDEELKQALFESIEVWKAFYKQSLEEGTAVSSNIN
ncbi:MAG: GTP-binding protein [Candidatus Lokiarchaeota archaeon]|nr:GTP-binding protein [Candidatus Lokiarchaeota archaeon]